MTQPYDDQPGTGPRWSQPHPDEAGMPPGPPAWQPPGQQPGPQDWQPTQQQPLQPPPAQPGYDPQAYSPQGYNPQGYNPQAYNPQAHNPQAHNPQAYNPQPYNPQGYNPQGYNPQGWDQLGPAQPARPRRRGRLLVGALVAAALVGGAGATYVATSDSNGYDGAASPQAAVTSIVSDLNKADLLGVLDHLPPDERDALVEPLQEQVKESKRLKLLRADTKLNKVAGVNLALTGVTFEPQDDQVNDHVAIVKVTGGTLTYNADLSAVPITKEYLEAAGITLPSSGAATGTLDIGERVRSSGNPLRLAAVKAGGKWYPSIFYSIADAAVRDEGSGNPSAADYIAPVGASSPEDAVKQLIDAAARQDATRIIALTSPKELAVLHDYGGLIARSAGAAKEPAFTVDSIELTKTSISSGQRVQLKSITVSSGGDQTSLVLDSDCVTVTTKGDTKKLCTNDAITKINEMLGSGNSLTAQEQAAVERAVRSIPRLGIATSKVGGSYYIDPLRTFFDLSTTLTSNLQDNDYLTLIKIVSNR